MGSRRMKEVKKKKKKNLICDVLSGFQDASSQFLGHILLFHPVAYRTRILAPGLKNVALQLAQGHDQLA